MFVLKPHPHGGVWVLTRLQCGFETEKLFSRIVWDENKNKFIRKRKETSGIVILQRRVTVSVVLSSCESYLWVIWPTSFIHHSMKTCNKTMRTKAAPSQTHFLSCWFKKEILHFIWPRISEASNLFCFGGSDGAVCSQQSHMAANKRGRKQSWVLAITAFTSRVVQQWRFSLLVLYLIFSFERKSDHPVTDGVKEVAAGSSSSECEEQEGQHAGRLSAKHAGAQSFRFWGILPVFLQSQILLGETVRQLSWTVSAAFSVGQLFTSCQRVWVQKKKN